MKKIILAFILAFSVFISACGNKGTEAPDLCSSENLPAEVIKVNNLMREFDDYSELASNTPQAQLTTVIPDLQRILRDAEDQTVPACLETLKKLQLAHMNIVAQTLMAFLNSSDLNEVNAGIAQARDLHNQYDVELARLLGVTVVPPATNPAAP